MEKQLDKTTKHWFKPIYAVKMVIFLCTVNNLMHLAVLYHLSFQNSADLGLFSHFTSWEKFVNFFVFGHFQSYFVSFVVDCALITLVWVGNDDEDAKKAGILACMLFVINILYADIFKDIFDFFMMLFGDGKFEQDGKRLTQFCGKIIFSGFFSYTIHYFAQLNVRLVHKQLAEQAQSDQLATMQQLQTDLEATAERNQAVLKQNEAILKQTQAERERMEANTDVTESQTKRIQDLEKQLASEQAKQKIEQSKRTLYRKDKEPELCGSIQALSGKLAGLDEQEKEFHQKEQEKTMKQWAKSLSKE